MALSKSTRIIILLVIDSAFFLLELVTGYAVHSLALVADSFHMLNDVLSLCVGLWAVKMANRTSAPKMYTYGYQRAETLGALVNGVFLVALCVTIFLDAIERFVTPQTVSNPVLVLIVGCLGLCSNLVGLVLFHEHSHSHGGHSHSHSHSHADVSAAEEGHAHSHSHSHDHSHSHEEPHSTPTPIEAPSSPSQSRGRSRKHSRATSKSMPIYEEFAGPTQFRNSIIAAGLRPLDEDGDTTDTEEAVDEEAPETTVHQPLLNGGHNGYGSINHHEHKHRQPKEPGKGAGGHSHGDLNMRGIFLHVMGDALGNVGVIVTALIIWLTSWPGRFYFDPAISLVITIIILCSAIPLCTAASRILLQAVPHGIEVDDIRDDIEDLPGIDSIHHLHIWQLSDKKLIASLHVKVAVAVAAWTDLAEAIRTCLHEYGIHSSTIQPEFEKENATCTNCCETGGCCPVTQDGEAGVEQVVRGA